MATGGLTPLRGNNTYIGWTKEAAWGTGLAPTSFWRWEDGTAASPKARVAIEREGDTSPFNSLAYKSEEHGEVKVAEYVRPRTIGCAFQGLFGTGSDTYTAPTKATTLAASIVAGATGFSSTADLGNIGTLALNFSPGVASTAYEVRTADLTSRAGAGPYTYNLAGGATFGLAHASSDALTSASTHVLTRQSLAYDPYCIEVGRGDGVHAPFQVVRFLDGVCYQLIFTSAKGRPLKVEHDWYATSMKLQNANASPVLEGSSQIGAAGSPFMHYQAGATWSLNSLTTGNALTIEQLVVRMKNTTAADEFATEAVNPAFFTMDDFDVTIEATVVFNSFNDYYMCYFGNTTAPAATAVDSYLVGYGQFSATWSSDAVNSLALSAPYCAYTAAEIPMKLDGKPIRQQIMLTPLKSASVANPVTWTLSNSQNSQY